jgi:hypothetical protein
VKRKLTVEERQRDSRYDLCPNCGKPKRKVARLCKDCQGLVLNTRGTANLIVDRTAIDQSWLSEFRGLFWGEGSAMIVPNNGSYGPILALNLRIDDRAAVESIQEHLGGKLLRLSSRIGDKHYADQMQWRATRLEEVQAICELLLADMQIPAKKVQDVRRVLEFIEYRLSLGRYLTPEQRLELKRLHDDLRSSREVDLPPDEERNEIII